MHGPHTRKLLAQVVKRGRVGPIPKHIAEAPRLRDYLQPTYDAFWELCSERRAPEAPIPWTAILAWMDETNLRDDSRWYFQRHIRSMDLAHLGWRADKAGAASADAAKRQALERGKRPRED